MEEKKYFKKIFFGNKMQFVFVVKCLQYKLISVTENRAKIAKRCRQQTKYDIVYNFIKQALHLRTIHVKIR